MSNTLEIGIIGLGKFGFILAESLVDMGHTVVGVDANEQRIRLAQDVLTKVYQADATDKQAVVQLGLHELPTVVVSVGDSMESSILITLNLKELGAPLVCVKALSEAHETVLHKLGADLVIFPERFVARQLAQRLVNPGLLDYIPLGRDVALREIEVRTWTGKTLKELALTNRYEVQVVAVKPAGEKDFNFVPAAGLALQQGDVLLVMGKAQNIEDMLKGSVEG